MLMRLSMDLWCMLFIFCKKLMRNTHGDSSHAQTSPSSSKTRRAATHVYTITANKHSGNNNETWTSINVRNRVY